MESKKSNNVEVEQLDQKDQIVPSNENHAAESSADSKETESLIEPERINRILNSLRISLDRTILEGLATFINEHVLGQNEILQMMHSIVKEANDSKKNVRKVSVPLKILSKFVDEEIRFGFRMHGVMTAIQKDLDADGYIKSKEEENVDMES